MRCSVQISETEWSDGRRQHSCRLIWARILIAGFKYYIALLKRNDLKYGNKKKYLVSPHIHEEEKEEDDEEDAEKLTVKEEEEEEEDEVLVEEVEDEVEEGRML